MKRSFYKVVCFFVVFLCIISCYNTGEKFSLEVSQKAQDTSVVFVCDRVLHLSKGTLNVVYPSLVDDVLMLNPKEEIDIRFEVALAENEFNITELNKQVFDLSSWFVFNNLDALVSDVKLTFAKKEVENNLDPSRMFLDFSIKPISVSKDASISLDIPGKIGDISVFTNNDEIKTNVIQVVVKQAESKARLSLNDGSTVVNVKAY